jgi:hypothetical protein
MVTSVEGIHKSPMACMLLIQHLDHKKLDIQLQNSSRKLIAVLSTLIFELEQESSDEGKEQEITLHQKIVLFSEVTVY